MLEIDSLTKTYARRAAVDRVSFSVARGEVLGFLGPNGAGKSTTMRMIAGVILPDAGDARIDGHSITAARAAAQARLGYLPEGAPLYEDMTPPEFLAFLASARDMPGPGRRRAIDRAIADTRISGVTAKPIGALSKGYRRRVGLAGALLHDPPVLVLDEPTDGLDPNQKRAVRALIARLAPERAILISTHTLEEVPAMCHRALVVDHGRIVADGAPEDLAGEDTLEEAFRKLTRQEDDAQAEAV
ncbi:MAG: ATP-binding cassette domain-containing protein [Alphaproteobacteria bacterium]|nr:ATP-binding cassette domain-containing protein [Alphaproteobacteria bacterium]